MKINKRIILYLDNQMKEEEKRAFEAELDKSPELSNQLKHYNNVMQSLKIDEQNYSDQDYFVNLVPNIRKILSGEKKPSKFKTAYVLTAFASVLVVVLLIFNLFRASENNSVDKLLSTLSENEVTEIFDYYSDDLSTMNTEQLNGTSDSLLTELISSELNLQEADLNSLVFTNGISIESLYSEIKSEEADFIYNEIINKKYF